MENLYQSRPTADGRMAYTNDRAFKPGDRVNDMENTETLEIIEGPFPAYMVQSSSGLYDTVRADRLEAVAQPDPRIEAAAKALHALSDSPWAWEELTNLAQAPARESASAALEAADAVTSDAVDRFVSESDRQEHYAMYGKPTTLPNRVTDRDGDEWVYMDGDEYRCLNGLTGVYGWLVETYGPLTEVRN